MTNLEKLREHIANKEQDLVDIGKAEKISREKYREQRDYANDEINKAKQMILKEESKTLLHGIKYEDGILTIRDTTIVVQPNRVEKIRPVEDTRYNYGNIVTYYVELLYKPAATTRLEIFRIQCFNKAQQSRVNNKLKKIILNIGKE